MADFLNGIFFSEILADNARNSAVDTDGDGRTNKADEYIEFGNVSGEPVSLAGYQVWSQTNGQLFTFGPNAVLNSGETATVVGNYNGTPPAGFFSAGIPENGNFIPDGEGQRFDSIFLVDPSTGDYIVLSYGQPPRPPTLPAGFPGTRQVGSGESINSNAPNGISFSRDLNGTLVESTPTPGTPNVACFTNGTIILTKMGEKPVEQLRPGDMVPTYDNGMQRLLGVCTRHFSASDLLRTPALRPLTVDKHLFGAARDICLSPAHCLMFTSAYADILFASQQVLVRARHLQVAGLARETIPREGITYYHLLFGEHELVMANGYWSESYLNIKHGLTDEAVADRAWDFVPGVSLDVTRAPRTVRPVLHKYETGVLVEHACIRPTAQPITAQVMPLRSRKTARHVRA